MSNDTSQNNFWGSFPLVSGLLIAASVFMYLGYLLDPNKTSDNSFFNLIAPGLDQIRNGRYWGLFTSSLFEINVVFFIWGVGWIWYFGKIIENHVSVLFYILLVISSLIFPELFQILIFERTGYGLGGVIYALFGFTWFMSVAEPTRWYVSHIEKILAITFIFLCILVDYAELVEVAIGALVGGFIWGVFIGFVATSIKIRILRVSIPMFVLGALLIPVFWAPWQISWLANEADKYKKQNELEKAKEYYSKVVDKQPGNERGEEGLISVLHSESEKHYKQREFEKSKVLCLQILKINPQNKPAKKNIHVIELYEEHLKYYGQKEFEKSKKPLLQILEINPGDENTKKILKTVELYEEFLRYDGRQEIDKAKLSLQEILEINPDDEATKKLLRWVELREDFVKSYDNKEFEQAERSLVQMLEIEPNDEAVKRYLKIIRDRAK